MTKIKNRILIVLALVMLCAVGVFALAACNNTETYTVTFMVRENGTTGDWQQYTTVDTNDDGSVTLPAEPTVDGYTFRDWYTDEACSADNVFDESNVTGDITVYALMAEANITLNVRDGEGQVETTNNFGLTGLEAKTAEYEADALANDLTFVGWFTDAAYTQEYTSGVDATALYGRYMAEVTFDNGYESDEIFVVPGETMSQPSSDMIVKSYMDPNDIFYVYADKPVKEDGSFNDVDFKQPVEKNTVITVQWKTPGIRDTVYQENSHTGNLYISYVRNSAIADANYPVISLPSRVTVNGQTRRVEVISLFYLRSDYIGPASTIIYQEGIKAITNNRGEEANYQPSITDISLPSTLIIIEDSFNYIHLLRDIDIPDNVQVILSSFWKGTGTPYDFEIEIPDSVINLSDVPTNFTFSGNSSFVNDGDNIIYQNTNDGKVLIADTNVVNGVLEVPEDYAGIQVGAFNNMPTLRYLYLPESWSFVQRNVAMYDASTGEGSYPFYAINSSRMQSALWHEADAGNDPINTVNPDSFSIIKNLDELEYVIIWQETMPQGVESYILIGNISSNSLLKKYADYTDSSFAGKVNFLFNTTGDITININGVNEITGEQYSSSISASSGGKITEDEIIETLAQKMGMEAEAFIERYEVEAIQEFGRDINFDEPFQRDMFLDVVFTYKNFGIITEENSDGTLTVTGFDQNNAELVGESTYLVIIPNELNGKKITAIADEAFKGKPIARVIIGNSITTIGARAFMDTKSLTSVEITPGGLQVIGESAFENSGFTSIVLSLATITDIGPNAFKSAVLEKFIPIADEISTRILYSDPMNIINCRNPMAEEGFSGYFFMAPGSYSVTSVNKAFGVAILKYVGKTENVEAPALKNYDSAIVTMYDVQLIAVAGGMEASSFVIGYSGRGFSVFSKSPDTGFVVRFEVMEGSVYYLNNVETIKFGLVSKVHEGAFSSINADLTSVEVFRSSYAGTYQISGATGEPVIIWDAWIELEEITSVAFSSYNFDDPDALFEDGWWCGIYSTNADYETKMQFMADAEYGKSGPNGNPENECNPFKDIYGDIMLTM